MSFGWNVLVVVLPCLLLLCFAYAYDRRTDFEEHLVRGDVAPKSGGPSLDAIPLEWTFSGTGFCLILLATMDGKVTGLNGFGRQLWEFDTGLGPLISGTLDQFEFRGMDNGAYRIIPSLDGQLYMYAYDANTKDQSTVQRMPITADSLLTSSQKLGPDVVSGGKDIRSYGVDLATGKVMYECGIEGCHYSNLNENEVGSDEARLIFHRTTRIIRAVDLNDGTERWNISMATLEAKLPPREMEKYSCGDSSEVIPKSIVYKIVPPEGRIVAFDSTRPDLLLWERTLESPIAKIWEVNGGIREMSILDPSILLFGPGLSGLSEDRRQHQVNTNRAVQRRKDQPEHSISYLVTAGRSPNEGGEQVCSASEVNALMKLDRDDQRSAGVYFSTVREKPSGIHMFRRRRGSSKFSEDSYWITEFLLDHWIPLTFTVVLLTIPTILYCGVYRALYGEKCALSPSSSICDSSERINSQTTMVSMHTQSSSELSFPETPEENFKSRYLEDFEPVRCLGKGGFGVVFEARKIMEDCTYAVKRVSVPNTGHHPDGSVGFSLPSASSVSSLPSKSLPTKANGIGPVTTTSETSDLCLAEKALPLFDDSFSLRRPNLSDTDSNIIFADVENTGSEKLTPTAAQNGAGDGPNWTQSLDVSSGVMSLDTDNSDCDKVNGALTSGSMVPLERRDGSSNAVTSKDKEVQTPRRKRSHRIYLYIQMQLCADHTLREFLRTTSLEQRRRPQLLRWFRETVEAVSYVHSCKLMHRDLKPSNIFFTHSGSIKVGDFGLVTEAAGQEPGDGTSHDSSGFGEDPSLTNDVGTQLYMSPEQAAGKSYTHKIDIFALGLIYFELLVSFSTEMERIKWLVELKSRGTPKGFNGLSQEDIKFVQWLIKKNPDKRPDCPEILAHVPPNDLGILGASV